MSERLSDSYTLSESFKKAAFSGKAALLFSSWFGSGLMPRAPGTFGTLAGLPLVIIANYLGGVYSAVILIILLPLAFWVSDISRKLLGRDDPPEVVIDEVAGLLVAVFLLPFSWLNIILGFLLFRAFDILKPFPVRTVDRRIKGGAGIVLDDILAGIYANLCIRILLYIFE